MSNKEVEEVRIARDDLYHIMFSLDSYLTYKIVSAIDRLIDAKIKYYRVYAE